MDVETLEKRLFGLVSDLSQLVGTQRVGELLGEILVGASRTKAGFDRNVESLLALASIPSRRDYRRLETKLASLQGSMLSLARKLDRLAETMGNGASAKRPKRKASARVRSTTRSGKGPRKAKASSVSRKRKR